MDRLRSLPVQFVETSAGVILRRGGKEFHVEGPHALDFVTVLLTHSANGATREQLLDRFAASERRVAERLIDELCRQRLLVPFIAHTEAQFHESPRDIFFWRFGASGTEVDKRLAGVETVVAGVNELSQQLCEALAEAGFAVPMMVDDPSLRNCRLFGPENGQVLDEQAKSPPRPVPYEDWLTDHRPQGAACIIATSTFGAISRMRHWNEICLQHCYDFLPVVLRDQVGLVGPLVVPHESACYECLYLRENANLSDPALTRTTEAFAFEGQAAEGYHPAAISILAGLATLELTKFYGIRGNSQQINTLLEVDFVSPDIVARKVLRVPRCPACSAANEVPLEQLTKSD